MAGDDSDILANHLKQFDLAPYLFIGSGLSRRYIGLETWGELLQKFAKTTSKPYEYFKSKAESKFPKIASEIAAELHDIWWTHENFADSRASFQSQAGYSRESALKIEISRYLREQSKIVTTDPRLTEELTALRNVVVDGIITTNWDLLLEGLFPTYEIFVGQEQLLFKTPQHIGEIYKIHGCCTEPNSLVLTEKDYEVFDRRNPYLVAKLLTVFIEHPIVFLGYSLTDQNIAKLLGSVIDCLSTENLSKLQNRLIFVEWDPTVQDVELSHSIIVSNEKQIPVISLRTNGFLPIFTSLQQMKRRFPAKLLRELKERLYELVASNDPKGELHVLDIEDDAEVSKLEVVFGIGTMSKVRKAEPSVNEFGKIGYREISRIEIFRDVVLDDANYDARSLLQETIPSLLGQTQYVPIFKYLAQANFLDFKGKVTGDELDERILKEADKDISKFRPNYTEAKVEKIRSDYYMGITKMSAKEGASRVLTTAGCLEEYQLSTTELLVFLQEHIHFLESDKPSDKTNYGKLVCLYDYLKYKRKR